MGQVERGIAKDYLTRLHDIQLEVEAANLRIADLSDMLTKVTSSLSLAGGVDGGNRSGSRFAEAITEIMGLQGSLSADVIRLKCIEAQIAESLKNFKRDNKWRRYRKVSDVMILRFKYVNFMTLAQIADKVGMDVKSLNERHVQALDRFAAYVPAQELWE